MAVYTQVEERDLVAFATEYDIGEVVSYKGIAEGVENSNYLLRVSKEGVATDYILTLYEKRVALDDLPYFLNLIDHLSAKNIACPAAIHGIDGAALRNLAGRPAAIFTFLDGIAVRHATARHCRDLGAGLAALHLAAADFADQRANNLSLDGWRQLAGETRRRADEVAPGLAAIIDAELEFLTDAWPGDLPTGVIHADLFPDNVFFLDGKLSGFIDFYFACNDLLAYDIAVCLNAWCFTDENNFAPASSAALIAAYGTIRPLSPPEIAALPILARGAALRFLLTRLYDFLNLQKGALVQPKDPLEYLARLQFHQQAKNPGAYGV